MSDSSASRKASLRRNLPLIGILVVAVIGAFTLKEFISFETLRDNRERLLSFRDANFLLTALIFIGAYVALVAFSLPGAIIGTLTGGFLFGTIFGSMFTVTAATIGATAIFLAARYGYGETPVSYTHLTLPTIYSV